MNKWDLRFIELTNLVSGWSKDKNTQVGCCIVNNKNPISMGFNGFPKNVNENISERHERPMKYLFTVHAEINAIVNAAKNGQMTNGCDMFVNYYPCCNCAGAIVNAGIKRVICNNKPDFNHHKWGESWKIASIIFDEAGVEVNYTNQ